MELGLLPSEFLSVVLEESEKNSRSSNYMNNNISQRLSTSVTISPVLPKSSTPKKKLNGKYSISHGKNGSSKLTNGAVINHNDYLDLKRRLPRTVLEECIVELADSSSKICNKVPEPSENAVIIKPMYAKKIDKQQPTRVRTQKEAKGIDFRDLFARVEAVYSDDDDPPTIPSRSVSATKTNGFSTPHLEANLVDNALSFGYACDHCPNKYSNKGALWQHNVAAHSVEKSCECQLCGRKFYRNCSLALHMKCHSDEQNCSCKVCGKEFNRLSALERHVKCHNIETANAAARSERAATSSAATAATVVVAAAGNVNGNASVANSLANVSHTGSSGSGVVSVNAFTAFSTASVSNTGINSSATTTTTVAAGAAAPASTSTSSGSTSSVSVTFSGTSTCSTSNAFVCKICGKSFSEEVALRTHMFTHSEKFACEQCNVAFNTKQLLDLHYHITHKRSETPFACKLCKARFANLRELNEHAASHTYEKVRISCHHCGEVFSQRCSYKKHVQLHVGERLSCTICRIDFTQRSSLLRHYKRLHLMQDIPNGGGPTAVIETTPNLTIITK